MIRSLLLVLLGALCIQGCTTLGSWPAFSAKKDPKLLETSYKAGTHLDKQVAPSGAKALPMLAASFVNAANFEDANDLGRLLSEQVASRLSQLGYSISEVQLRTDQLVIRPKSGVFALSRNTNDINPDPEAFSILVGTYTVIERQIYVNARILRTSDGVALGSTDFVLPYIRLRPAHMAQPDNATPSVHTRLQ
ncbi:FlgO family outer membrane protein [Desulfovibrionales bacterium]